MDYIFPDKGSSIYKSGSMLKNDKNGNNIYME